MDMQKQILTHNPNINASKIGLGLACLLCTVIGSVRVKTRAPRLVFSLTFLAGTGWPVSVLDLLEFL